MYNVHKRSRVRLCRDPESYGVSSNAIFFIELLCQMMIMEVFWWTHRRVFTRDFVTFDLIWLVFCTLLQLWMRHYIYIYVFLLASNAFWGRIRDYIVCALQIADIQHCMVMHFTFCLPSGHIQRKNLFTQIAPRCVSPWSIICGTELFQSDDTPRVCHLKAVSCFAVWRFGIRDYFNIYAR